MGQPCISAETSAFNGNNDNLTVRISSFMVHKLIEPCVYRASLLLNLEIYMHMIDSGCIALMNVGASVWKATGGTWEVRMGLGGSMGQVRGAQG